MREYSMTVAKFITYGERILLQLDRTGWWPGARYTNLRTVKRFNRVGFLDIDWRQYCFETHLTAAKLTNPVMTVARDLLDMSMLEQVVYEANQLKRYSDFVVVVPKDPRATTSLWNNFPFEVIQGYSVPTRYGGTEVNLEVFNGPVHLLGGGPLPQRNLAKTLDVVSLDNNRITVDAKFGKFFDGRKSTRHPKIGRFFDECIHASIDSINLLWEDYSPKARNTLETIRESCGEISVC